MFITGRTYNEGGQNSIDDEEIEINLDYVQTARPYRNVYYILHLSYNPHEYVVRAEDFERYRNNRSMNKA